MSNDNDKYTVQITGKPDGDGFMRVKYQEIAFPADGIHIKFESAGENENVIKIGARDIFFDKTGETSGNGFNLQYEK